MSWCSKRAATTRRPISISAKRTCSGRSTAVAGSRRRATRRRSSRTATTSAVPPCTTGRTATARPRIASSSGRRGSGWRGTTSTALEPHFARIEADLSVHRAEEPYVNTMNRLLRDAATRIGWAGAPVPQARKGCVKSGYCMQGCSYDAKQSQLVTTIPRAVAVGARLYADRRARVLGGVGTRFAGVTADVLDRATGRPTGTLLEVEAKAIVVAAGGYETPAFLIRQGFGSIPAPRRALLLQPVPDGARGLSRRRRAVDEHPVRVGRRAVPPRATRRGIGDHVVLRHAGRVRGGRLPPHGEPAAAGAPRRRAAPASARSTRA